MKKPTLKLRKDAPGKCHYYLTLPNGRKFSVVDFKKMMESLENYMPAETLRRLQFWEAMELAPNGDLITENMYRADSKEQLIAKLWPNP